MDTTIDSNTCIFDPVNSPLVRQFKAFYRDLHHADLAQLERLYSPDAVFKDPIHELRGLVALQDYMDNLCGDLDECRFDYLDELVAASRGTHHSAYIKWVMHFRHPRLGNRQISVRGVSHIQFTQRIHFHEDIYDLGQMLYEHIPVLGGVTRWIKRRLTN